MKNALKLLFLLAFITGIPSCCNPPEQPHYEVGIGNFYIEEVARLNAQGQIETYRSGDTLEAEKEMLLKIRLVTARKEIAQGSPVMSGFLSPSAYACDEGFPSFELAYQELELSIVSPYDYDERYPAGADLSALFQVYKPYDSTFRPLPALFAEDPLQVIQQFPDLRISQSPAETSRQVFEIRLRTADTTFRARTPPVILK
ncbi:MAG: hypothetical protein RI842_08155 [Schleiferiaceae bacterium]|nr:hypothetical protein [Schleiferiaceae bacterium]MDR9442679.1 hypothetical protein [Schleiferiaceae bacterium]